MIYHQRPTEEANPKKKLGLVQVYTGDGKGKTTAALGLALRALGHDYRVLMVRFLKGHKDMGEIKALGKISKGEIEILPFAHENEVNLQDPAPLDHYLVNQAMDHTRRAMEEKRPDLLILDEINPVVHHGLLDIKELMDFLDNKHQQTEVVLTGQDAHPDVMNYADLVTVMNGTKHYFDHTAYKPRYGIEH